MDACPLERTWSQEPCCETLEVEIATIRRAFGPALPQLLQLTGLQDLRSRGDLQQLAHALRSRLGL